MVAGSSMAAAKLKKRKASRCRRGKKSHRKRKK